MATINQLVRKPRVKSVPKNKVPALEACLIRLCVRFAVCV